MTDQSELKNPEWVNQFINALDRMFGDIVLQLTGNQKDK